MYNCCILNCGEYKLCHNLHAFSLGKNQSNNWLVEKNESMRFDGKQRQAAKKGISKNASKLDQRWGMNSVTKNLIFPQKISEIGVIPHPLSRKLS